MTLIKHLFCNAWRNIDYNLGKKPDSTSPPDNDQGGNGDIENDGPSETRPRSRIRNVPFLF